VVRTQIQLTEAQVLALKTLARDEGTSMAELIRRSIDAHVSAIGHRDRDEMKRRALAVAGRFRSGVSDLSKGHDRYLAETFGR